MIELAIEATAYESQFGTMLIEDFPFLIELLESGILHWDSNRLLLDPATAIYADDICHEFSSPLQNQLYARHLKIGRSKVASQYFPITDQARS